MGKSRRANKSLLSGLFLPVFVCTIGGCATTYPECEEYIGDEEKFSDCNHAVAEFRRGTDQVNWDLCNKVILDAGLYTLHYNHDASHTRPSSIHPSHIRNDLFVNKCRWILRGFWAEY